MRKNLVTFEITGYDQSPSIDRLIIRLDSTVEDRSEYQMLQIITHHKSQPKVKDCNPSSLALHS